jgi:hypothetical protein
MEKVEKARAKRNLEGNSSTINFFSVLSIDEIIHTTANMGVVLDNNDFDTFSFLNDLENGRHDLYQNKLYKNKSLKLTQLRLNKKKGPILN